LLLDYPTERGELIQWDESAHDCLRLMDREMRLDVSLAVTQLTRAARSAFDADVVLPSAAWTKRAVAPNLP
jgi:hypothetical protein